MGRPTGAGQGWTRQGGRWQGGRWQDERQRAVWNQASATALALVTVLGSTASVILMLVDYRRFAPSAAVLLAITVGGSAVAQALARRQGVRPVMREPSWLGTVAMTVAFGVLFFALTLRIDGGPGSGDWPVRAVASLVVAVFWGLAMRAVMRASYRRARRDRPDPAQGTTGGGAPGDRGAPGEPRG